MKITIISILLLITVIAQAQNDTPDLITDRPDQTESSITVPHKSLQIETGFVFENIKTESISQKSHAYNTTLFRYGLLHNFEIRLGLEYLGDKTEIINTGLETKTYGLSPLYAGFKTKIADEDGCKPEIAFLGGLILPFTAHEDYKSSYTAADIRFSFAHTLSDRLSLGYNLGAQWDGETAVPGYFYSAALGAGITEKIGFFLESYGLIYEEGDAEHMLDAGITYLALSNLQFDISAGIGINEQAIDNFISFGLSYRLPE